MAAVKDYTQRNVAYLLILGVFAMFFFVVIHGVAADVKEMALMIGTALVGAMGLATGFYYGTSKSSQAKDEALLTKPEPPTKGDSNAPSPTV